MADANELLFDRSIRHQIDVRRYTTGELKRMISYLEKMDTETAQMLRMRIPNILGAREGTPVNPLRELTEAQTKRYQELLADVRALRMAAINEVHQRFVDSSSELVVIEANAEQQTIQRSIPISDVTVASVTAAQVRSVVYRNPFGGKLLKDWMDQLALEDSLRIKSAIADGFVQGQTNDTIVRNIVGTRANQYADGVTAVTRRNAQTIARTATTAFANGAREEVWKANTDIILGLRWTSVLDGRTSAVCRSRDGEVAPNGYTPVPAGYPLLSPPGARPPAHPNCRSTMVPVLDAEGIVGNRPTVTDTRTRKVREVDFRANAKEKAGADWKNLSRSERLDRVRQERSRWAQETIGNVPAKTTYSEWLTRQPAGFQDDVMGPSKGRLFRQGGLKLDQFVDHSGRELTLSQLKARYPDAFERAHL